MKKKVIASIIIILILLGLLVFFIFDSKTYIEKNNLTINKLNNKEFSLKGYLFKYDEEKKETSKDIYEIVDSIYKINSIEKENLDNETKIILDIEMQQNGYFKYMQDNSIYNMSSSYFANFLFFDKYTGIYFNDTNGENEINIRHNGVEYKIKCQRKDEKVEYSDWVKKDNIYQNTITKKYTLEITVPSDYDGLLMGIETINDKYELYENKWNNLGAKNNIYILDILSKNDKLYFIEKDLIGERINEKN